MAHMHITGWVLGIILVLVVASMYKKGNMKPGKILHMILRLVYLLILGSGIGLFMQYANYPAELFVKVLAGLWAIVAMEMITVGRSKGNSVQSWWIQLVIALAIAIILGFVRLPMGILP